jgi:hypothetical protein
MIETPGGVIEELAEIRRRSEAGLGVLEDLERKLVIAELEADKLEAQAILNGQGTVVDRQALAKLASMDKAQEAALLRVQVNRAKAQLRHLSESMGAVQTSARMIELQWRTAGVGER